MKLNGLFLVVLLLICGVASAQTPVFEKGNKVLNLGLGFGNGFYSGGGYYSQMPALSASLEVGAVDNVIDKGTIGVGGYLGYSSAKWEETYLGSTYGFRRSNLILAARGSFHYPLVEKLDTYAGLSLGFNIDSRSETGNWPGAAAHSVNESGLYLSAFLGARYYFTEKYAAMAELGSGIAYLNLGVAIKL